MKKVFSVILLFITTILGQANAEPITNAKHIMEKNIWTFGNIKDKHGNNVFMIAYMNNNYDIMSVNCSQFELDNSMAILFKWADIPPDHYEYDLIATADHKKSHIYHVYSVTKNMAKLIDYADLVDYLKSSKQVFFTAKGKDIVGNTAKFDLTGFNEALEELNRYCPIKKL